MDSIPKTMRAVMLQDYNGVESLNIKQVPVPQPGPGQVLVRMAFASLNPSDLMYTRGLYGFKKPLPTIPGFEGSGTVVAAGSGLMPKLLRGKRVACSSSQNINSGTWAEYLVTDAQLCVPLQKRVSLEQGTSMIVNPFTAWALMQTARQSGHRAILQTAAASALGQMIIKLGKRFSIDTVNIVRRDEQVALLRKMDAKYVLNSSDKQFSANLRKICNDLQVTLGFDAVAGELSSQVLREMPLNSRLLVYGGLSEQPCPAGPDSLIFEGKIVQGFWLLNWFKKMNMINQLLNANKVQRLLATDLKTDVHERIPLEDIKRGIEQYAKHMTGGKLLLQM